MKHPKGFGTFYCFYIQMNKELRLPVQSPFFNVSANKQAGLFLPAC